MPACDSYCRVTAQQISGHSAEALLPRQLAPSAQRRGWPEQLEAPVADDAQRSFLGFDTQCLAMKQILAGRPMESLIHILQ